MNAASELHCLTESVDIVVVDDDSLTLEIISWILKGTQISYRLFVDPEVALEYLSRSTPSVLIVDYYMPAFNGIEFLQRLRDKSDHVPDSVFLCSAVRPPPQQLAQLDELGAEVLDKECICDRSALLGLVGSGRRVTGND